MRTQPPDVSLMLAACLLDCFSLSDPAFAQALSSLAPACPEFDPLRLHDLLTGADDDPQRALLHQAAQIVDLKATTEGLDRPLHSVFNRIVLDESPAAENLAYAQTRWSEINDAIFPHADHEIAANGRGLLTTFLEAWLAFAPRAATPEALLAGTFSLLDEYLWCIPADPAQTDVPFSEMLRLKSAVAACLWQRQQAATPLPDAPFRLVAGDLSGIQAYVFGITEGGKSESGTAKRLRARSLFVQLLAEVGMWQALSVYNLPPCNILMMSGGKFLLLWPNLPEHAALLNTLQRSVDDWLRRELHGTIGLALASVEVAEHELRCDFGNVIERIEHALFQQKHRLLATQLQTNGGWHETAFVIHADFRHEVCPSCQRFPRAKPDGYCLQCDFDREIGTEWGHQPKWLALYANKPPNAPSARPVLNMWAQVLANERDLAATPTLLFQLGGSVQLASVATHAPLFWRSRAPYVNRQLSFSPMAQKGEGRDLLGYVKADADHIGMIFQYGFRRDSAPDDPAPGYDTPARFAALSRQFDRFFGGWLSQFLEQHYPDSYTVFAGGDDVFVIGRWDTMLRCARDLQSNFRRFSGQHPKITLSAGITLVKERYPLAHAAREAEEEVKRAKQEMAIERPEPKGRDQIALLGDVLTWKTYQTVLDDVQQLHAGQPRSALLYALLQYAEMWRKFKKEHDYAYLCWQPFLAYNITRNVRRKTALWDWAEELVKLVITKETTYQRLDHLGTIVRIALFQRQGGDEHGRET